MQFIRLLRFAFDEFGPLLVFWSAVRFADIKTAIIVSTAWSIGQISYKIYKKERFTNFFKFSAAMTVVFGILDTWMTTPVFFKYESVFTNIVTGIYFAMTLRTNKSFIQEWVEKKNGTSMENRNAILRCQILTLVWTQYFFAKAAYYFYVASNYSLEEAILIRSTVGTVSFYALLGVSIVFGKRILTFFQTRGLLPMYPETP
jgi:intracellular septation protein A